jgi:hypothetical protein
MGEINRLIWPDLNPGERYVEPYTRKKKGHLTPMKVPMTRNLFKVLSRRFEQRERNRRSSGKGTGIGKRRNGLKGPTRIE